MNIKCIMLLACLSSIVVLPEAQGIPLRRGNLPRQNLQRNPVPRNLPRPVPSSPPSPPRSIPISRPSTLVSSVKTTTIPIASKKVEQFAQRLRDDLNAQERVLHVFITTLQKKHTNVEMNLKRVRGILSGLRLEIANATRVADRYQIEERTQAATTNLVNREYTNSKKMYEDEKQNLKFEKEFLDAIIKYIKLQKC